MNQEMMQIWIHKCINVNGSALVIFHDYGVIPKFSHYALSYISESGNKMILDATDKNVSLSHINMFKKKYKVVGEDYVFQIEKSKFTNWMENKLGMQYGYFELVGIGLKKLGLFSFNPLANAETETCNELVIHFLNLITHDNTKGADFDLVETEKYIERIARWQASKI